MSSYPVGATAKCKIYKNEMYKLARMPTAGGDGSVYIKQAL